MMTRRIAVWAAAITLAAAASVTAQDWTALTTSGDVWTNDVLLPSGVRVGAGDRLRTGDGALAIVSSADAGRVEVRAQSDVTLRPGALELHRGAVAIDRGAVRLGEIEIAPTGSGPNWIVVSRQADQTLVAAYRGEAVIHESGGRRIVVPAGTFALAGASPPRDDQRNDRKGAKTDSRGAAKAASRGGWRLGPLSGVQGAMIVTGIAAATVAGLAVSGSSGTQDVSPQR